MSNAAPANVPVERAHVDLFLKGTRKTVDYIPQAIGGDLWEAALDGRPLFNFREAMRMRREPKIEFGLRILRAPLYQQKVTVEADSNRVGRFVKEQFQAVWDAHLRQMLNSMLVFGPAVGEVSHRSSNGLVVFDRYDDIHPMDSRPLTIRGGRRHGRFAGIRLTPGRSDGYSHNNDEKHVGGSFDIEPPHAFWCPGEAEYGSMWGRPRIAGAHEPFLEKRGKGGAVESRRLWYKKCAFRGGVIRHPMGKTEYTLSDGSTFEIENEDIAREIVERYENGGVLTMPNSVSPETKDFLWTFEPPGSNGEVSGVREYPQDLDTEMLEGMGIVPEIVAAATVGSGYSGRSIPAQVFFASEDELAKAIIPTIDRHILRPMVAVNYGRQHARRYRILPQSLAELVAKSDPQQAGKMLEEPDSRNDMGGAVFSGTTQSGRERFKTPDGRTRYKKPAVQLSLAAQKKLLRRLKRAEKVFRLSWSAARTARDTTKAIGTGKDAGKTLYGAKAKEALTARPNTQAAEPEEPSKTAAPPLSVPEYHALVATVPEGDRAALPKIVRTYHAVRDAVFVKLSEVAFGISSLAPAILDTSDDYTTMKASVYGDHDAFKDATGISWAFTQTLVKHAIAVGFKLAGHKPEPTQLSMADMDDNALDAAVQVLAAALKAAHQTLGIKADVDETVIRELLAKRMEKPAEGGGDVSG